MALFRVLIPLCHFNAAVSVSSESTLRESEEFTSVARQTLQRVTQSGTLRGGSKTGQIPLGQATGELSHMIEEQTRKIDLETVQCSEYEMRQKEMLEEVRQDIGTYNAQSAGAREALLAAEGSDDMINQKLPAIGATLKMHNQKCDTDMAALQRQLQIILSDVDVLERVVEESSCSSAMGAALLQCSHSTKRGAAKSRFVTFNGQLLRKYVAKVSSPFARQALQAGLAKVYDQAGSQEVEAFVQLSASEEEAWVPGHGRRQRHQRQRRRMKLHRHLARKARHGAVAFHAQPAEEMEQNLGSHIDGSDVEAPANIHQQQRKCTIRGDATCVLMRDALLQTQTGIADKAEELKRQLAETEKACEETRTNYVAQITDLETRQKDVQSELARATQEQNAFEEQSRLKTLEAEDMNKDYKATIDKCELNLKAFEKDSCGVRKVRLELFKMQGLEDQPQDCEVAAWTPDECPVSCGGGVQRLARKVTVLPRNGGASCPPLEMQRRCNEQACPVHCELTDWGDWSSCSANCGGGILQRSRLITTAPKHGGMPCGKTGESQSCNGQSCDADCELHDWSAFSPCSKMCNSGLSMRMRRVKELATGNGKCPAEESPERLEYLPCNEDACAEPVGRPTLQCRSKLDVILLLDGSASLGQDGWNAVLQASQMLVGAFAGPSFARVGVVKYSGPTTFADYRRCTQGPAPGEAQPDLGEDCGVSWVSHLSEDPQSVAAMIPSLEWPEATTLTSTALMTADAELRGARPDARSVVIVITDGKPMSPLATGDAAARLRQRARLMWVPVTRYAPLDLIRGWATRPVHENVVQIDDFETLSRPSTISSLVSSICQEVA